MDRWLQALQKTDRGASPLATSTSNPVDSFLETYGNRFMSEDEGAAVKTNGLHHEQADVPDPVTKFLAKNEFDRLHKSTVADESWDRELLKTTELSASSNFRFKNACTVVERVFAGHPEQCQEAIQIMRRTLDDERAAILAAA